MERNVQSGRRRSDQREPNPRVRMRDVARSVGVSAMTVSRVLRGVPHVSAETRSRVFKAIETLGYVPDQIAGSLSSQRSGFVAVLVPSLNNPHFADTVGSLADGLRAQGLQVLIGHTNYRPDVEEALVETMLRRRPEVIVLTYDGHSARTRQLLSASGIPVIEIWETPAEPLGHVVGFSNQRAARSLTRDLIARGYRRIAFIGESDDVGTRGAARRRGVLDALAAAKLDTGRQLAFAPPPINMNQGAEAIVRVLGMWPDTDCVICVSDPCAFGAVSECRRRGIAVPGELAVAGFGDFEVSRCAVPSITTVSVDATEIGLRCAALIEELQAASADDQPVPARKILVEVKVALRESA